MTDCPPPVPDPRRPPVSNFARHAEIRLLDGDSAQHNLLDKENNADSSYRERYYGGDDGLSKAEYLAKINPSVPYPASGGFDCYCYAERYQDLRDHYGWNCEQLKNHWNSSGQSEGRIGTCDAGHEVSMEISGRSTNDGLALLNQLWRDVAVPFPNTIFAPVYSTGLYSSVQVVTKQDCLSAAVSAFGSKVTSSRSLQVGRCGLRRSPLSPARVGGEGRVERVLTDAPLAQLGARPLRLLGEVGWRLGCALERQGRRQELRRVHDSSRINSRINSTGRDAAELPVGGRQRLRQQGDVQQELAGHWQVRRSRPRFHSLARARVVQVVSGEY